MLEKYFVTKWLCFEINLFLPRDAIASALFVWSTHGVEKEPLIWEIHLYFSLCGILSKSYFLFGIIQTKLVKQWLQKK